MHPFRHARRSIVAVVGSFFFFGLLPVGAASVALAATPVFINEIDYDNVGTDAGEAIEVAGPAGTDLTGWSIVLYNGSDRSGLRHRRARRHDPESGLGFWNLFISYPVDGIQNGAPDGLALVNGTTVVQFLSYEGTVSATNGPASGTTSIDIGVDQQPVPAAGLTLGLTGTGTSYESFAWTEGLAASFGAVNPGPDLPSRFDPLDQ